MNKESFLREAIAKSSYAYSLQVEEGFDSRDQVNRPFWGEEPLRSILPNLPTFAGRRCDFYIEQLVQERGEVRVLDIGCGAGKALGDLVRKWGRAVVPIGITARRYKALFLSRRVRKGIIEGDASHLNTYFNQSSVDVIFSAYAIDYFQRHPSNLLPRLYRVLSDGGVAFLSFTRTVDAFGGELSLHALLGWLSENGYTIEMPISGEERKVVRGTSMKKTHPRLRLPITYHSGQRVLFNETKAERFAQEILSWK